MPRYKDYIQDDEQPFGRGTFVLDDDSEFYLDDPPRARSVLEELYGKSGFAADVDNESTNIAERGSADRQGGELDKRQKLENAVAGLAGATAPNKPFSGIETGPSRMRRAVAGAGGGDELDARQDELAGELDATEPEAGDEEDTAPRAGRPPEPAAPSEQELREMQAAQRYQQAASLVPTRTRGTDPRALGPGVAVDKNFSRKGGLSPEEYNRQAQDRETVHTATNEMVARQYQEDRAVADVQAQKLRGEAIGMRKVNDAQELELQRKQQKYADDRAWLEKDVDAHYDERPDPDGGLRKKRGVIGNLASTIAQMMGAYASVISGTPNFANQILNKKMDQSVDAQIEEFRRGRAKRDGQMARMAERGMSIEQMRGALKLQQELALQREVKAAALEEGTRESKQAAEALLMSRNELFVNKENEYRTAALGEQTVSGEYVRPTGGRELSPIERAKQINELLEADVQGNFLAHGGAPAERQQDREIRQAATQGKRQVHTDKTLSEYSKRREAIPDLNKVDSAADRLAEIDKTNGGFPGIGRGDISGVAPSWTDRGEMANEVDQLRQTLLNSLISAKPGNKSDADAIRLAKEGLAPEATEAEFRRGIAIAQRYARDQRAEIEASVDDDTRKAYDERYNKRLVDQAKKKRDEKKNLSGKVY